MKPLLTDSNRGILNQGMFESIYGTGIFEKLVIGTRPIESIRAGLEQIKRFINT